MANGTMESGKEGAAKRRALQALAEGNTELAARNAAIAGVTVDELTQTDSGTETVATDTVETPVIEDVTVPEVTDEALVTPAIEDTSDMILGDEVAGEPAIETVVADERQTLLDSLDETTKSAITESLGGQDFGAVYSITSEELKTITETSQTPSDLLTALEQYKPKATPETVEQPEGFQLTDELASLEQVALTAGLAEDSLVAAREAYTNGYLTEETYKEYLKARATTLAAESTIEDQQFPEFTYEEPSSISLAKFYEDIANMDFASMQAKINTMIESGELAGMSSAAINSLLLTSAQLTSSNAMMDRWQGVYDRMADRASDAYDAAVNNADLAQTEIDNIISGTSDVATTIESLMVKVQKQQADLGTTSIDAQMAALNAEYEFTYNQMLEQNSRLEGYMKAKLNYMGAQDSSAGLTLMATAIDNAQQRLLLYQSNYTSDMVQLEVQKTQLMNDYYNSVTEQLINIDNDKSAAYTTYEDKMGEIEANELATLQESETQQLSALQDLTTTLYTIEQNQKSWEYQMASDTYNRAFNEAQVARDIEAQFKAEAATNLDMLLSAYAGLGFDQVGAEGQQAMVELAQAMGLPESYARDALAGLQRQMAAASRGSGDGGSTAEAGTWNAAYEGAYQEVLALISDDYSYSEAWDEVFPGIGTDNTNAAYSGFLNYQNALFPQTVITDNTDNTDNTSGTTNDGDGGWLSELLEGGKAAATDIYRTVTQADRYATEPPINE